MAKNQDSPSDIQGGGSNVRGSIIEKGSFTGETLSSVQQVPTQTQAMTPTPAPQASTNTTSGPGTGGETK